MVMGSEERDGRWHLCLLDARIENGKQRYTLSGGAKLQTVIR